MRPSNRFIKIIPWIKIIRLQFYPMAFIAYGLGAAAAYSAFGIFNPIVFALGYLTLFLIEICSVLSNEYYDYDTDRINKNASIFTGGSRMLVEGKIKPGQVRAAIKLVISLIIISAAVLAAASREAGIVPVPVLILAGLGLGLGYTAPPLKFCYRGLGEAVVGLTHSPYMILCGFVFQTGVWGNPLPWLLSLPLFFAILAAIILAGIPDFRADKQAGKNTVSVIIGPEKAAIISVLSVFMAVISGFLLIVLNILPGAAGLAAFIIIPHAFILSLAVFKLIKSNDYDRRIDNIMRLSLSYIAWFGIVPLIVLLRA